MILETIEEKDYSSNFNEKIKTTNRLQDEFLKNGGRINRAIVYNDNYKKDIPSEQKYGVLTPAKAIIVTGVFLGICYLVDKYFVKPIKTFVDKYDEENRKNVMKGREDRVLPGVCRKLTNNELRKIREDNSMIVLREDEFRVEDDE